VDTADDGYSKGLRPRHVGMIAIGGSIGTGLFLAAGGRLSEGGPALALVYLVCGGLTFVMMRALGEMTVYRPSSGAYVSYAREFSGERLAYVTGWMYFLDWAASVMGDATAVALYLHYWTAFRTVPQWILALIVLGLMTILNLFSVRFFGEAEFWFAMIKVFAISAFLVVALVFVVGGLHVGHVTAGPSLISSHGGLFPKGVTPLLSLALGVIFAYGGCEMVGVAAGETKDAKRIIPRAVNSTFWRIALFYVGSVILLALVLPWTKYSAGQSPFVTFFKALDVPGIGTIMNLVVITAAMSSTNSGLYATSRALRSLAAAGSGPKAAARLNRRKVPAVGILIVAGTALLGVVLNYVAPGQAFSVIVDLSGLGIASTWISIMVSHWLFVRLAKKGLVTRPAFRLWGAPYINAIAIALLGAIIVGTAFGSLGVQTILAFAVIFLILFLAWRFIIRDRIHSTTFTLTDEPETAAEAGPVGQQPGEPGIK
jgi:L-asparagine permease